MKILQVMAGGKHGGAETAFVDMCIAMHEAGETIEVATRPNDIRVPQLEKAGIKIHTLPFGGKIDVFTPWKIQKIIKNFQPDIVQCWMSRASWKVPKWKPNMNIPRYHIVARLGGYYKLKYFKSVDRFIPVTTDIKNYLIKKGIPEHNICTINNFAELEEVKNPINRAEYNTPKDAPLLLGLGRLHPAKAFDTLIETVNNMPGIHLWIAGEGPQREELEKLIKRLNCGDRIKLLGWRTDRAALLQAADICTFTSRFEPFGTVFVQAWAQKTPIVVTASDGPRQFVRDGEDGLIVEIDNKEAIQNAIQKLIDNPDLQKTFINNGWKRYQNEFTKEICLQRYLEYYHAIKASIPAA